MAIHPDTCGCPECTWPYNPKAIHNQSCGCPKCQNYPRPLAVQGNATKELPVSNKNLETAERG